MGHISPASPETLALRRAVFIVIAAFNEERRLGGVLEEVCRDYPNVIVVDDGSMDGTADLARKHGCFVLRHAVNRGQGAALQTGITFALTEGASYVVTFDADGQHLISDLPALLAPVAAGKCEVALGNRFLSKESNVPTVRRVLLRMAQVFTWVSSGLRVGDCHNGYRVFSRVAASRLRLRQDRMAHASELYDQIRRTGMVFREVPVTIRYTADTLAKGQRMSNSFSVIFQYFYGKITR